MMAWFDHCLTVRRGEFDSPFYTGPLFYSVSLGVLSGGSIFPHHQKQTGLIRLINSGVVVEAAAAVD